MSHVTLLMWLYNFRFKAQELEFALFIYLCKQWSLIFTILRKKKQVQSTKIVTCYTLELEWHSCHMSQVTIIGNSHTPSMILDYPHQWLFSNKQLVCIMKSYCIDHSHVINDKDDSSMKTSQPLILGSFLESLNQNCTDVRPRILRILKKSSRMNLYRFLSVCRPDNDPIDCPRFLRINRMIKLIHLSLFITSSLIHFIIHINNIHLLKWHLVVRFIVRDAIIFCRMEFRFAIKFGRHCLSHTLKPDRSYNRFEFGWFGRTKASQIASTPQKYGYQQPKSDDIKTKSDFLSVRM